MSDLVILATNDLHGQLTPAKLPFLAQLRANSDLYFDSGDAIKTGNLGLPLKPEQVWPDLANLNCTASCPGNRESHVLESGLTAKTRGLSHPMVCCNWTVKSTNQLVFPPFIMLKCKGLNLGVTGVMVPMVTPKMRTAGLSHYLWTDPIEALTPQVKTLRSDCDLVIVLSHLGHRQDQSLAQSIPEIDLILGGHSHTVLATPEKINNTWIAQGGSHAKYVGQYTWSPGNHLTGGLIPWP